MSSLIDVEAVIVAGGRATRMGGVDKPALVVGGRRLLDIALAAVAGCRRVTVVGPRRDDLDPAVIQVQERPAGAGPVAALAAAGVHESVVLTLAADLPFLTADTVTALVEALRGNTGSDAAFAIDNSGRIQYLLAAWRGPALAGHLAALGSDPANQPMKALLPERYVTVPVAGTADCDTPQELAQARAARSGLVAADPDAARAEIRKSLPRLPVRTRAPQEAAGATLAAPLVAAEA
ncbi:molybdenum cofactor guanylyltransferase, partial [Rhodococcus indonesiensis]